MTDDQSPALPARSRKEADPTAAAARAGEPAATASTLATLRAAIAATGDGTMGDAIGGESGPATERDPET